MSAKIEDLMTRAVISAQPENSLSEVRRLMNERGISAVPVLDGEGGLLGIVTSTDLLRTTEPGVAVRDIMSERVYTAPPSAGVHVAARIMRNHHTHHVVVTHDQRVVGVIASYDLLRLVEDHRYVARDKPSSPNSKHLGRREQRERSLAKARREKRAREDMS